MVSKARPWPSVDSSEMGNLLGGPGVSPASPEPSIQHDSLRPGYGVWPELTDDFVSG